MKSYTSKDAVSSEEFAKFMMSLQDSSTLVMDPSKTISSAQFKSFQSAAKLPEMQETKTSESLDTEDIFSRNRASSVAGT